MNKNRNSGSAATSWMIVIGCMAGVLFCALLLWFTSDDMSDSLSAAAVIGAAVAVVALFAAIQVTIVPFFKIRRAAFKALGRHSITVVMRDKTARTCYKGITALMKGNVVKAEKLLDEALSRSDIRQNQLFCVEWLGHLYEETNNRPKLIWCYRKAVELAPENPDAQCRLGQEYYTDGVLDKSMYCFEQALRYDPNNGYAYYSMAKIHIIRGEDDKAQELFDKLLAINESHPLVYAELAIFNAMKGDREKSEEYCQKAILCGYREPEALNARLTAIFEFGQAKNVSGEDLPRDYYRRVTREDIAEDAERGEENA